MEGEQERELGMQQNHRNHILSNIESLINCTNYNEIMNETVRRGLFAPKMRQIIETRNNMSEQNVLNVRHEQHKLYFQKITKRGPRAYEILKDIVRNLGHIEALRILEAAEDQTCGSPYVSLSSANRNSHSHGVSNSNSQGYSNNNQNNNPNQGYSNNSHSSHSTNSKSTDIVDNRIKPQSTANGTLAPYTEPVVGQTRVVTKSDRIHTDSVVGQYKMQSEHERGVLLIVNIIDFLDPSKVRSGAEGDGDALIHIFRQIGFKVFYHMNLKQDEFFHELGSLTDSEYVERTECFVMVLMTHGERYNEKDRVVFSDGSVSDVKTILDHFQADKCPHLVNKPKVLIFPFCRGDRPDQGKPQPQPTVRRMDVQTDGTPYTDFPPRNVPTLSDLMVCYASTPGYETHRDPQDGSWYIQSFCDAMAQHAHNRPLDDILMKTQEAVIHIRTPRGNLQTGEFNNLGFNKKLFFNPGFYLK